MKRGEKQKKKLKKKQPKNATVKKNKTKNEFTWSATNETRATSAGASATTDDGATSAATGAVAGALPSMEAWNDLFLPQTILKALQELGFSKPTEIQQMVLPTAIRDQQDIVAAAETVRILANLKKNFLMK